MSLTFLVCAEQTREIRARHTPRFRERFLDAVDAEVERSVHYLLEDC